MTMRIRCTRRHTATPGFWWYISSHLHGAGATGAASGPATKTPATSPVPMPSAHGAGIARRPPPLLAPSPGAPSLQSVVSAEPTTEPIEPVQQPVEPVERTEPSILLRKVLSGSGPAAPAKTLNRFLRGSDLLTSITNTFDRKWRSLVNPMGQGGVRSSAGNSPFSGNDEENEAEEAGPTRAERKKTEDGAECEAEENQIPRRKEKPGNVSSVESYRDPSLHKTWLGKSHLTRQKNDAPEKDTDSSIADSAANQPGENRPDNDRSAIAKKKLESRTDELPETDPLASPAGEKKQESAKLEEGTNKENEDTTGKPEETSARRYEVDSSYSNKLERFESLTNSEVRSRLKRSESLNKRSESASTKLKRSESLNKHSSERLSSPTNGKLKRSESLNKHSERSDSPNSKLKRSESLTKTEKTECNISKRRQSVRKDSATKLKRKNGMPERSIKRRHTVGGTKDFDKVHWLDNKLQSEAERVVRNDYRPKKSQLRTSSPDLSTGRMGVPDASFLIEVSFRGPSNVVFNVTNTRPQSLPDASLASKVFKVPLESHV